MHRRYGFAVVLLCATASALAHDLATATANLDTLTVTAAPVARTASDGHLRRDELERRPIYRVADMLEYVPGLIATQHSGSGKANQYFLRGFNLDHGTDFAVFVDGVPINLSSHSHGQGYTDLNFLIPEVVESLDYRKGAYDARAGDFSTAGSAYVTLAESLTPAVKVEAGEFGRRRARSGLFAQTDFSPATWLAVSAGLRVDRYGFDVTDRISGARVDNAEIQSSPKLSLVMGPWNRTSLYAAAGRSFHSNDARGVAVNSALDAIEAAQGAEAGLLTAPLPGMTLTLGLWWLELDSELVYVGDAGETEARGQSRRRGLEFTARYEAASWLTLEADWAATQARLANGGTTDRIPNALPRVGRAGAFLRLPQNFTLSLAARHFAGAPLVEDGSVYGNDATRVDLGLIWKPASALETRLDMINLFDSGDDDIQYFYESRLAGEATPVTDRHFHPGPPRMLRAAITVRFPQQ